MLALVPEHNPAFARALETCGFQPVSTYAVLAKRLARPSEELAQEPAKNAVTVS